MNWGPEKILIRCSKESHHPAESWAAGPPVKHQENNADSHKSRGQNVAVMFGLQLPLTRKPWITFSNPYNKVRGTYFKRGLPASLLLCRYDAVDDNLTLAFGLVNAQSSFYQTKQSLVNNINENVRAWNFLLTEYYTTVIIWISTWNIHSIMNKLCDKYFLLNKGHCQKIYAEKWKHPL